MSDSNEVGPLPKQYRNLLRSQGPGAHERRLQTNVRAIEEIRQAHHRIASRVRSGELSRSWEVLKALAFSSPHFLLDWSFDYSNEGISRKLSQHLVYCLWQEETRNNSGGIDVLPFCQTLGDEVMVRVALNWSPIERFQLEKLHGVEGDGLLQHISERASTDALFFDALVEAKEFLSDGQDKTSVANALFKRLKGKEVRRPIQKRGRRPDPKIVYRRMATRLFQHEMRSLGFAVGPNDETQGGRTATDAAHLVLKKTNKYPPSVRTIRQDWQQWNYKDSYPQTAVCPALSSVTCRTQSHCTLILSNLFWVKTVSAIR